MNDQGKIAEAYLEIRARLDTLDAGLSKAEKRAALSGRRAGEDFSRGASASILRLSGGIQTAIMAAFGGGAVTLGLHQLGRESMVFQQEFANVTTLFDTSKVSASGLRGELVGLGGTLGKTTDLAKALYQAISAGIDPSQAVKFVAESAKFARAGMTSTLSAVDVLTTAINAYGMAAEDVTSVSDTMFTTVKLGKTTVEELSAQLGKIVGIAATAGVSFDELNAAVAALTVSGVRTEQAITGLKAILANIGQPSKEAADTAKQLGIDYSLAGLQAKGFTGFVRELTDKTRGNVQAQKDLFGSIEAFNAIAILASDQGGKKFNDTLDAMAAKAGATNEAFKKQTETLGAQLDALWTNLSKNWIDAANSAGTATFAIQGLNQMLEGQTEIVWRAYAQVKNLPKLYEEAKKRGIDLTRMSQAEFMSLLAQMEGAVTMQTVLDMAAESYTRNLLAEAKSVDQLSSSFEKLDSGNRQAALNALLAELQKRMFAAGNQGKTTAQLYSEYGVVLENIGRIAKDYNLSVDDMTASAIRNAGAVRRQAAAERDALAAAQKRAEWLKENPGKAVPLPDWRSPGTLRRPGEEIFDPRLMAPGEMGPGGPEDGGFILPERGLGGLPPMKVPQISIGGSGYNPETGEFETGGVGDIGEINPPPDISPWEEFSEGMHDILGNLTDKFGLYQESLQGAGDAWREFITGQAGGIQAMRQFGTAMLGELSRRAFVKALYETAEGFAALFWNPAEAAAHFKAAAFYGMVAGVSGAATRGMAGGQAGGGVGERGGPFNPVYTQPGLPGLDVSEVRGGGSSDTKLLVATLNRVNATFSQLQTMQPGPLVKAGVGQAGGVLALTNARDRRGISAHVRDASEL